MNKKYMFFIFNNLFFNLSSFSLLERIDYSE